MTQPGPESAEQKLRQAYDKSEKRVSQTSDALVATQGFADALGLLTSNAVAMSRIVTTGLDQVIRTTRLAGQRDINRLARQLNRTEDKLEQVLQVVELLEAELTEARAERDEARRQTVPVQARAKRSAATGGSPRSRSRGRTATVTSADVTSTQPGVSEESDR